MDIVTTLMDMYGQFRFHRNDTSHRDEPPKYSAYDSDVVLFALKEKKKEIAYTRKKAEALLSKVQNTRTLVWIRVKMI
jgi:hypothetical protein